MPEVDCTPKGWLSEAEVNATVGSVTGSTDPIAGYGQGGYGEGGYAASQGGSALLSVWLTEAIIEPPPPPGFPSTPQGLSAVNITGSTFTLAWNGSTAPAGAEVLSYNIFQDGVLIQEVTSDAAVVVATVVSAVASRLAVTISGLTAGTIYDFTIAATNINGSSPDSGVLQVKTVDPVVPLAPNPPASLTALTVGTDNVKLNWPKSTLPTGAAAVTEYRVFRGGTTLLATVPPGAATTVTYTVTGLNASTAYAFTVRAWNGLLSIASPVRNVTTLSAVTPPPPPPPPPSSGLRFKSGNYWEKPLPANAPIHGQSASYINYLVSQPDSSPDCRLNGGGDDDGLSVFHPGFYDQTASDPIYHISDASGNCPPLFGPNGPGIRIPTVAKKFYNPAGANDSPMMLRMRPGVGPVVRGYYAWFAMLLWEQGGAPVGNDADRTGRWRLAGIGASGAHYFTDTFGHSNDPLRAGVSWPATLLGTGRSPKYYFDEPLNGGFRGCNAMIRAINYDRVKAEGRVNHVMELFQGPTTAPSGRWPMTGFEDHGPGGIPEGSRIRIKPSVDVAALLAGDTGYYGNPSSRTAAQAAGYQEAVAIAKGMQAYGIIVADNSGNGTKVKLVSTAKQGRGNLWQVNTQGLRAIPFARYWEFIADGYDPPDPA